MKKILILFVLEILFRSTHAQDKPQLPACIIVNLGMNLAATEKIDYYFSSRANAGFSGGAMYRTDGDLYLTGGIQYVIANPTMYDKTDAITENVTMQFLQIPVMGGIQILKSQDSKRTLHGQFGGSFSEILNISENHIGITKDAIKTTGFNVKAGVGVECGQFTFDINYNLLMTHLYDVAGEHNTVRFMCWEFLLGYKFDLKKKYE